jgi:hypothetical protein
MKERRLSRDRRSSLLLELCDRAFERQAWHGPTLRGAVRGLALREALWRPGRGRHNIWEIVLHTAYWKFIVRRRLTRDRALAFPRAGSNWPALPPEPEARGWKRDVALLQEQHRRLRAVIARFPATGLDRRGWLSRWTNAQHIHGIAAHDLYHAGRIQLLKRLQRI